jgi:hypothetical protein
MATEKRLTDITVDDQYPVKQLAADSANPSFGDRVRPRRPPRCTQDAKALAGEHGVKLRDSLLAAKPSQAAPKVWAWNGRTCRSSRREHRGRALG